MNITYLKIKGNMINKNKSPVKIIFVTKISDIINLSVGKNLFPAKNQTLKF